MNEPNITVYGAFWCPDCHRSKQFLGEHQIPYRWVDIEEDKVRLLPIDRLYGPQPVRRLSFNRQLREFLEELFESLHGVGLIFGDERLNLHAVSPCSLPFRRREVP